MQKQEIKFMVIKSEGGGINWEIGTDTQTRLYVGLAKNCLQVFLNELFGQPNVK